MGKFLKIFCMAAVSLIMLSGCGEKQEISEQPETEQTEQSETEDKTEDKIEDKTGDKTGDKTIDKTDGKAEGNEAQNITEEEIDFSNAFQGINGCAVLYSPSENRYSFYNKALSEQEDSPYSTFKIVSALMGLHNDIIKDESSTMNYNGTEYPNPEWNGNLTFQEAFQTSCIWYFRQIIDAVGEDEAEKELSELEYGNCDISQWEGSNINPYPELNGFWLNASLKISPLEQVAVLSKIFEGKSIYDRRDIEILKKVMLTQDNGTQQIYGKTGSGSDGEAWFVGFIETAEQRRYFAVYLNDVSQEDQISGSTAKEIALKILE